MTSEYSKKSDLVKEKDLKILKLEALIQEINNSVPEVKSLDNSNETIKTKAKSTVKTGKNEVTLSIVNV